MAAANPTTPEPRRFSIALPGPISIGLATVALVVTGIGLQIATPIYRQQAAIREIERLGGQFYTRPEGPVWLRDWVSDERLGLFDKVVGVNLSGSQATDATLANFKSLRSLQWLQLSGTQVTDAGLAHLMGLTALEQLWIANTRVTDGGLAHIKEMTSLQRLELGGTQVTDAGLAHLNALNNLRALFVNNTHVTDSGLDRLTVLTNLNELRVCKTLVSDKYIAQLQSALPGLTIER